MHKYLIVTADDFGLDQAVNEAVQQAATTGVLTAASLMVAAPATEDAVRRAQQIPQLRVGLHLTLADGWSVLPRARIPALVDAEGRFGNRMFVDGVRFFALPEVRRQLRAEIRAQFEAYARTGLPLDHVNAHKHFHLHPTLLGMILSIGREFNLPAVRVPYEPLWFASRAGVIAAPVSAAFLSPWVGLMKKRLRGSGILHNDRVFGIACSGALNERTLLEILARLPRGVTEIYLHPATATDKPLQPTMRHYAHAEELAALTSPRVRAALLQTRAICGGYGDLPRIQTRASSGESAVQ